MASLESIRRLFEHLIWADALVLAAFEADPAPPAEALREYGHILGCDEVWLSRLEQRTSRLPLWPQATVAELLEMSAVVREGYRRFLDSLDDEGAARIAAYTNTKGQPFENRVEDILLHVALHAHYHRGKVNLLLRQGEKSPAPADYISFLRGVPAAVTAPAPPSPTRS